MFKFFKILSVFLPIATPLCAISCSNHTNSFVFFLSETVNQGKPSEFIKNVEKNFRKLDTNNDFSNLNISYKIATSDLAKKQSLENGSGSFAFLKVQTLMNNDFYKQTSPKIQTLTTPFTFDLDMSKKYVNGNESDPLIQIAKEMQKVSFGENYEHPHSSWTDQTYNWNGIRYDKFYDKSNSPVSGYRGMILLSGSKEKVNEAKTIWNSKEWEKFRDLGIIVGDQNSIGNYKLQELLLKKHFSSLGSNWTIESDKKNNPNKYTTDSYGTELIGKNPNFVVSFTDEASFAWTHRNSSTTSYSPLNGAIIEILTVTDPSLYDIGTFSKFVDPNISNLMGNAIIETYKNNNNLYGEGLGYNGYKLIENFDTEVVDYYNQTFNI